MYHAHVEVLGIIRSDDDLVLSGELSGAHFVDRLLKILYFLIVFNDLEHFLCRSRSPVEHCSRHTPNLLDEFCIYLRVGSLEFTDGCHIFQRGILAIHCVGHESAVAGFLICAYFPAAFLHLLYVLIIYGSVSLESRDDLVEHLECLRHVLLQTRE